MSPTSFNDGNILVKAMSTEVNPPRAIFLVNILVSLDVSP